MLEIVVIIASIVGLIGFVLNSSSCIIITLAILLGYIFYGIVTKKLIHLKYDTIFGLLGIAIGILTDRPWWYGLTLGLSIGCIVVVLWALYFVTRNKKVTKLFIKSLVKIKKDFI